MRKEREKQKSILLLCEKVCPDLKPSLLFWENGQAYISKYVDGELITNHAEKKKDNSWKWINE